MNRYDQMGFCFCFSGFPVDVCVRSNCAYGFAKYDSKIQYYKHLTNHVGSVLKRLSGRCFFSITLKSLRFGGKVGIGTNIFCCTMLEIV